MVEIAEDISLSRYSTIGVGGPSKYFVEIENQKEAQEALAFSHEKKIPYITIGKGSNCLFDDRGFSGLTILNKIDFIENISSTDFHVGSGYNFSLLGTQTARKGLTGLEFASGIPGTVGGAVFMNAGANGGETCNSLKEVTFLYDSGKIEKLSRESLSFQYRTSPFHSLKGIILSATFSLSLSDNAREKQIEIILKRKKTQPLKEMSAGCMFRNLQETPTGQLIEECHLKGHRIGGAEVSQVHANFIINNGTATSEDIKSLILEVQTQVREKTGYDLESEVRPIPFEGYL